jgi:S-DNA-T family DNA segregation ATPase FtsK/SpoIIIE
MSEAPERDGKVLQLRAVDTETEVRLDEAQPPGPSYVDLSTGDAKRRPVIPEHWRTRENARRHISLMAARHGHRAAYHGVRSPWYALKSLWFAVCGVYIIVSGLIGWWHVPGTGQLERQAAADGLLNDHLRLHKAGKETRKQRGTILALCLAGQRART